jgi:hypothetical protein
VLRHFLSSEVPMRVTSSLFAVLASVALLVAPAAQAQSTEKAQPKAAATTPAKPAPKAAATPTDKAKVEGAAAVRTTPADLKKSGSEKNYDGCGHGKMAASDA